MSYTPPSLIMTTSQDQTVMHYNKYHVIITRVGVPLPPRRKSAYVGRNKNITYTDVALTQLGNPFWMKSEAERGHVCDQYWSMTLTKKFIERPEVCAAYEELIHHVRTEGSVTLVCHCAPKRCHAESIAKIVLQNVHRRNMLEV